MTAAVGRQLAMRAESERLQLAPVFLITLVAAFLLTGQNLLDPMIRHDDYPAFFADAPAFWNKTLHEGRWLNYIWHLREVVTPAWLNFALYQSLWAAFVAAFAVAAMGPGAQRWFTVVLALLLVVCPSEMLISLWFNTLIPGLAVVALFAVLACYISSAQLRWLLPIFVIVSFMAYTTYPLLLLAICIARTRDRSIRDLAGLMALFCASFVVAVLTVYTLNWQVHGVFGVPVADWRDPTAGDGIGGIIANLPKLGETFTLFLNRTGIGYPPLIGLIPFVYIIALNVLRKRAPLEALYLAAGMAIGLALTVVQALKLGVIVPPRAFIFFWVFFALTVVRAVQILSEDEGLYGRLGRNLLLLIVGVWFIQLFLAYGQSNDWRSDTKLWAQEVRATEGPVYVYGDSSKIAAGLKAGIQSYKALPFRLKQLTGKTAVACDELPDTCPSRPDMTAGDAEVHLLREGNALFMLFTPEPSDETED